MNLKINSLRKKKSWTVGTGTIIYFFSFLFLLLCIPELLRIWAVRGTEGPKKVPLGKCPRAPRQLRGAGWNPEQFSPTGTGSKRGLSGGWIQARLQGEVVAVC